MRHLEYKVPRWHPYILPVRSFLLLLLRLDFPWPNTIKFKRDFIRRRNEIRKMFPFIRRAKKHLQNSIGLSGLSLSIAWTSTCCFHFSRRKIWWNSGLGTQFQGTLPYSLFTVGVVSSYSTVSLLDELACLPVGSCLHFGQFHVPQIYHINLWLLRLMRTIKTLCFSTSVTFSVVH